MGSYTGKQADLTDPVANCADVTPSDDTDLTNWAVALYVGTGGDLKVTTWMDCTVAFQNVPVGIFPVRVKRVWDADTAASDIVALW